MLYSVIYNKSNSPRLTFVLTTISLISPVYSRAIGPISQWVSVFIIQILWKYELLQRKNNDQIMSQFCTYHKSCSSHAQNGGMIGALESRLEQEILKRKMYLVSFDSSNFVPLSIRQPSISGQLCKRPIVSMANCQSSSCAQDSVKIIAKGDALRRICLPKLIIYGGVKVEDDKLKIYILPAKYYSLDVRNHDT